MNKAQKKKRQEIIKRHGKPKEEFEGGGIYCLVYSFGLIGIEKDGYSHM